MRITIVGAGLFGSIIGRMLQYAFHEVRWVDGRYDGAGSLAAGCVMKPSWAASMPKEDYHEALERLSILTTVHPVSFRLPLGKVDNCHWVDPEALLVTPDRVQRITPEEAWTLFPGTEAVIWCTGAFQGGIPPAVRSVAEARAGWSFFWPERKLSQPFITPWAPYKQVVGLNFADRGVWCGDGTSLIEKSATPERRDASLARCAHHTQLPCDDAQVTYGLRPVVKRLKEPALIKQIGPREWYVSGGAKNGTLGAAWAAGQFHELLGA